MSGRSIDVQWKLGPTTVYGTLVLPPGPGPFPAVVMVAGSGPTDRDWNSPLVPGTNGSARLIAEALAEAGIASLRYDKRVSGPHAQANVAHLLGQISMSSHVEELLGAVDLLAERPDIDVSHIYGLGNSEGTLHVLNYQLATPMVPLAGIILTGPPGRAVGVVARSQLAVEANTLPNKDAFMVLYDSAIARFLDGQPVAPDPALPESIQLLLKSLESPANLPFARELWSVDAAILLEKVDGPVLVIIGKKDMQIDWENDGERLTHAASGHVDVVLLFPDNANHVLKYEPKARTQLTVGEVSQGYNAVDAILDPETIGAILVWLLARIA